MVEIFRGERPRLVLHRSHSRACDDWIILIPAAESWSVGNCLGSFFDGRNRDIGVLSQMSFSPIFAVESGDRGRADIFHYFQRFGRANGLGREPSPSPRESGHGGRRVESASRRLLVGAYQVGVSMVGLGGPALVSRSGQATLQDLEAAASPNHHDFSAGGTRSGMGRVLLDRRNPVGLLVAFPDVCEQSVAYDARPSGRRGLEPQHRVAWPVAVGGMGRKLASEPSLGCERRAVRTQVVADRHWMVCHQRSQGRWACK